ncbi:MAG: efflux RND transporter periplasmic adaptor subunit [Bryobacteraceae bacterium]
MKKILIPAAVLLVAAGLAVYAFHRSSRDTSGRILVSGNIELTEVNIGFKTAGRLIERTVDEGDLVKKGQLIARLDSAELTAQRDSLIAGLASARSQLAQAETSADWERATLAADLEQRRGDLAAAEAHLAELKNGSRPQEIQEAKAAVDASQSEFDRAKKDWDRAQTLFKDDDISASQYDEFRNHWESADAVLKQAKERAALVFAGPRVEQVDGAAAQVERSRGALKMAEANSLELKRREQELATRRAEIERSTANLAQVNAQLADTLAVSPVDGVVLVKSADVGEVLAAGATVVTVGDIEHPWLRAYINETDLGKVKLGSKVRITTDSYPGKVYDGRVGFISSEAEFTPKQIQTEEERVKLVYRIKIDVDNPRQELKSNMPADAEILLD